MAKNVDNSLQVLSDNLKFLGKYGFVVSDSEEKLEMVKKHLEKINVGYKTLEVYDCKVSGIVLI